MFDSKYYLPWFDKLLDSLDHRGIQNAVIVMDNASYHKTYPQGTPKRTSKKAELITACQKYGIAHENQTCEVLWGKLSEHMKKHVLPVIAQKAKDRGHELLYSAPHYSDLEPIETVWAIVKGQVGRQYDANTKFADVKDRLEKALDEVSSKQVAGCIKKAHQRLDKLHALVTKLDDRWGENIMDEDDSSDTSSDDIFHSADDGDSDS